MAVYTQLTESDLISHLSYYDLGALQAWHGIEQGIENSNFYIETDRARYILTLFEKRIDPADIPYCLNLMAHLESRGIHCPKPIKANSGEVLQTLKDRPAVIISFMQGTGVNRPSAAHMPHIGALVARMHMAAEDFTPRRANPMSFTAWERLAEKVRGKTSSIDPHLDTIIAEELAHAKAHWPQHLPQGAIHADMFPDNVFFNSPSPSGGEEQEVSGVIDFYFACTDLFAYDLAIAINAWCMNDDKHVNADYLKTLLHAYETLRPLSTDEKQALPPLLRAAALRFLLTRTHDLVFHPPEALVQPKDPGEYIQKLAFFREHANTLL